MSQIKVCKRDDRDVKIGVVATFSEHDEKIASKFENENYVVLSAQNS